MLDRLFCPFAPAGPSPAYSSQIEQQTADWAARLGLAGDARTHRTVVRSGLGRLHALVYPEFDRERLQLATDWVTLLLFYDDIWCDNLPLDEGSADRLRATQAEILAGLRGEPHGDEPLAAMAADLRERLRRARPEADLGRFIACVDQYMQSNLWELSNRRLGRAPLPTIYLKMRVFSGGMRHLFELGYLLSGIELPEQLRRNIYVGQLALKANNHVCWVNDLLSFHKERGRGNPNNLVACLEQHEGLSTAAALGRVVVLCDTELRAYGELRERLPELGLGRQAELMAYLSLLERWVRGHLDWCGQTMRYVAGEEGQVGERAVAA